MADDAPAPLPPAPVPLPAIPPWLLAILKLACMFAPSVPPPFGPVLVIVCGFLPAQHRGQPITAEEMIDLKTFLNATQANKATPCG